MNTPYTEFDTIREIAADVPLLVGCFEKIEGPGHAFTLVNMQDFADPKAGTVRLRLDGKVTAYWDGVPSEMMARDGEYVFELQQGEGIFVTVE
jgi:hypothetical protein